MKQAGQAEHERVGHVSAAGKQRDELVPAHFLLFYSVQYPCLWDGAVTFSVGLPFSVKSLWKCSLNTCRPDNSKSCQVGDENENVPQVLL